MSGAIALLGELETGGRRKDVTGSLVESRGKGRYQAGNSVEQIWMEKRKQA